MFGRQGSAPSTTVAPEDRAETPRLGRLAVADADFLVNNAGYMFEQSLDDLT